MQHHFGIGNVFLTVTFDHENSLIMQVLSGIEVDDETPIDSMSDEELAERAQARRVLRLDYPGIASLNFEILLNILSEEVVGWDMIRHRPTDEPGLFRECYAFSLAMIEEQGRKTLHAHMTLWIKGVNTIRKDIFMALKKKSVLLKLQ